MIRASLPREDAGDAAAAVPAPDLMAEEIAD